MEQLRQGSTLWKGEHKSGAWDQRLNWRAEDSHDCAARRLLDRIGDKWSLVVLFILQHEAVRFNAMKRRISGISQRVLTLTLRSLERDGYISRTELPGRVSQVQYGLTPLGLELIELTGYLIEWAQIHNRTVENARATFDPADGHG